MELKDVDDIPKYNKKHLRLAEVLTFSKKELY